MNREACKFFSGAFAALAYVHGAYAVATSCGVINEPIFRGRKWGVGYMWTEAAIYSAVSVALGYFGWRNKSQVAQRHPTAPAMAGQNLQPVGTAAEPTQSASR
jgi:hypothetical protein